MNFFKKRILIIDDDPEIRNTFEVIISSSGKYKVVASYGSVADGFKHLRKDLPDIILMDIELPEVNGVEGVRLIKQHYPSIDIIMISVYQDTHLVFDSLKAGACGYITKGTNYLTLVSALDEVAQGGAAMSSQIARMVVNHFHLSHSSPLTDRETQILDLLSKGKTYSDIASGLNISKETSKTHIRNIYAKLKVNSKSEALEKAKEDRLI